MVRTTLSPVALTSPPLTSSLLHPPQAVMEEVQRLTAAQHTGFLQRLTALQGRFGFHMEGAGFPDACKSAVAVHVQCVEAFARGELDRLSTAAADMCASLHTLCRGKLRCVAVGVGNGPLCVPACDCVCNCVWLRVAACGCV